MSKAFHFWGVLLCTSMFSSVSIAETIVEKRLQEQNRLIPLEKITVGPFNNYNADLLGDKKSILYTRKIDLSPYIFVQDLKSGKSWHLLSEREDAEQPVVSENGEAIAFTYFKNRSFGEICHLPMGQPSQKMKCLTGQGRSLSSPFWVGNDQIGYLATDVVTQRREVVVQSLKNSETRVLVSGAVTAPTVSFSGKYLVYTKIESGVGHLVVEDLVAKKTQTLAFDLPGVSGLPVISRDEKYLYFSQYLNDTNNDQIIDGNDHSVIFRVNTQELFSAKVLFPEQLTSVENNCSFPRPTEDKLFVTCAFQGSLDIYALPLSGTVPQSWDVNNLWSAHRTARAYDERVLLLNSIRYRFPKNIEQFPLRALSNYYLGGNTNASRFYIQQLIEKASAAESKAQWQALDRLLAIRQSYEGLLLGELTPSYVSKVRKHRAELMTLPHLTESWRQVALGQVDFYLRDYVSSKSWLEKVKLSSKVSPLLSHLYLHLAQQLRTVGKVKLDTLLKVYQQVLANQQLPFENRVFYTLSWLKQVDESQLENKDRIDWVNKSMKVFNNKDVQQVLDSEVISLRLASAKEAEKQEIYKELDQIIRDSKDNYFLKRAIYTRAIYIFAEANEFRYLNFVANNWLRFTKKADTEFAHAREHLVYAIRDRAYSSYANGNLLHADNLFYQALSLTDDLESHYGYIVVMLQEKKREMLLQQYDNLKKRQFIEDNFNFVEAVLLVLEDQEKRPLSTDLLKRAVEKIEKMQTGSDSAMRALLLGYCQFEILERSAKGYKYNLDLMQEAHRNLMLAYDLGRDNERIKASALMNLGLLHLRTNSFRSSVKFLEDRGELPFIDRDDEAFYTYTLARAYYFSHQPDRSQKIIDTAIKKGRIAEKRMLPFLERRAFYAMAAGDYKNSSLYYKDLLEDKKNLTGINLAKANMSYGFSLLSSGDKKAAKETFKKTWSLVGSASLGGRKADEYHLLNFDPLRLKLHLSGFLARLSQGEERLSWLETRRNLLKEAKSRLEELSIKEARWYSFAIRNLLQIGMENKISSPAKNRGASSILSALKLLEEHGEEEDLWLGEVFFESMQNIFSYGLLEKNTDVLKSSLKVSSKILTAYQQQKTPSMQVAYQTVKLGVLDAAASRMAQVTNGKSDVWQGPAAELLRKDRKELYQELRELEKALTR